MSGAYLGQTARDSAHAIADDVLGVPRPVRTSSTATVADVVADALAYRAALAARQTAHDAAESAALGDPDPAPVPPAPEPVRDAYRPALVPGHGDNREPGPDFDAIVSHVRGRS